MLVARFYYLIEYDTISALSTHNVRKTALSIKWAHSSLHTFIIDSGSMSRYILSARATCLALSLTMMITAGGGPGFSPWSARGKAKLSWQE